VNFFAHQDRARRKTFWLVVLFLLAAAVIVVAANLVVLGVVWSFQGDLLEPHPEFGAWAHRRPDVIAWTSVITVGLIAIASFYKVVALSAGGGTVARALGGTLVAPDVQDPVRRRLRNVVEEISLAAGVPVPEVYVLEDEPGINAFAAGYTTGDAAIAVTRGALDLLDRDELQGVIAHEFSHIFNGDMRLNMRLLGVLFGIVAIAYVGRFILRGMSRARGGSGRGGAGLLAILLAGVALMVIGYLGVFFGNLIKAAVSRSREYLADASAVQFTRNPHGIAGALKKIAAHARGALVDSVEGEQVSHMLFADGRRSWTAWFATHPPIVARIRAIEPRFDPAELTRIAVQLSQSPPPVPAEPPAKAAAAGFAGEAAAGLPIRPDLVAASVGALGGAQLADAVALRASIPSALLDAAHSANEAVALALGLVLSAEPKPRAGQLARIREKFSAAATARIDALAGEIEGLGPAYRLPLLELAFPALKQRPPGQLAALADLVLAVSWVSGDVAVFDYVVAKLLRVQVRDALVPGAAGRKREHAKLYNHKTGLQALFSCMARFGHDDKREARAAYERGMRRLFPQHGPEYAPPFQWIAALDEALDALDRLEPAMKQQLIEALVTTIAHDGRVSVTESELLRAVCAALHCPLPPLTAGVRPGA